MRATRSFYFFLFLKTGENTLLLPFKKCIIYLLAYLGRNTYTNLLYTISFKKARKESGKMKNFRKLHIYNV